MVEPAGSVSQFGGRLIHWHNQPGADPTIVLMNGCGLSCEHWQLVIDLLPDLHVVTYDRPGLGGTPWPGRLPRLAEEVASLADLVRDRGAPAVLVAHSMASFHAEALARLHPELVAGVVMVDGSCEWQSQPPRERGVWLPKTVYRVVRVKPFDRLGSLAHRLGAATQSLRHSGHVWDPRLSYVYRDPDSVAMGAAESESYLGQAWDLNRIRAAKSMPRRRIIVLTAALPYNARDLASQHRFARLIGGRQVVVEQSHHLMMIDRPDAIVEAILVARTPVTDLGLA